MLLYSITFAVAFALTFVLTPVARTFAIKFGIVDAPGKRKIHTKPIPRFGGIPLFIGFIISVTVGMLLALIQSKQFDFRLIIGVISGVLVLFAIGVIDDKNPLPAWKKFIFQIIAATITFYFGVRIGFVSNPFGNFLEIPFMISLGLTLFWIVGVTNAINLIDGLDGLATGVSAIAAIALFIVALRTHQIEAAILLIALIGAAIGFLKYNFNPASIFLGDSGSYMLGFILAATSVMGVLKSTLVVALVIPILILGVPIFDTLTVILKRILARQNIFKADMRHLHHNMLGAGMTQRQVVLIIYAVCVFLSLGALIMTAINGIFALVVLVGMIIVVVTLFNILRINIEG